jgi:large subunit ribosomal protein L28
MAVCAVTGKTFLNGHKVSHSNIKSPKRAHANIQSKRVFDVESGRWVRIKVSAKGLKVLNKKSLQDVIKGR